MLRDLLQMLMMFAPAGGEGGDGDGDGDAGGKGDAKGGGDGDGGGEGGKGSVAGGEGEAGAEGGDGDGKGSIAGGDRPKGDTDGAPDEYKFEVPDSAGDISGMLKVAEPVFKKLGLSQEKAQDLVNLELAMRTAEATVITERAMDWKKAVDSDPEMGGEHRDATYARVRGLTTKFGDDALREFLNENGRGNNPSLVRFMNKIAKAFGEDNLAGSRSRTGTTAESDRDAGLRQAYPTMYDDEGALIKQA